LGLGLWQESPIPLKDINPERTPYLGNDVLPFWTKKYKNKNANFVAHLIFSFILQKF
jgi:hypothetical protein